MTLNRRTILLQLSVVTTTALGLGRAKAQQALLQESDPEALGVEYKSDAKKIDIKKSPKFKPGRTCGNCGLFHGEGQSPTGGCDLFYGKDVAAQGWCNAWEPKDGSH